jgi:hypothetical protein
MAGLTIIAVLAVCAFAAASASASTFLSTNATTLLGKSTSSQTFTTGAGAEVVCSADTATGPASAGSQLEVLAIVKYTGCKVGGIFEATVSEADYDFSADNELVNLLNTVLIIVPAANNCHVTVPPQDLKGVTYDNLAGGKIDLLAKVTKISSQGSGGACGGASTTGTYSGNTLVSPELGEFKWDA